MKTYKIAVLGATGTVGQRMLSLLDGHPWFEVVAMTASERSVGKRYAEAAAWQIDTPMPAWARDMVVRASSPEGIGADLALSALDADVAGGVETAFAAAGMAVISNARNHRMEPDVPLIVPEVNARHLELLPEQRAARGWSRGCIITNPNCSTVGLVMALKPLQDAFGVEKVMVTTMQAISGAGYPGVPSLDILDNVIPYIKGEEEKMEIETRKIMDADIAVSAHCNRVQVRDGHLECVSVKLKKTATSEEVRRAWRDFVPETHGLGLPTCPEAPILYRDEPDRPQPRRDRDAGRGMTATIGRLRPCPILDWKFVVLSHNTVRGAAGAALADAELLVAKGLL